MRRAGQIAAILLLTAGASTAQAADSVGKKLVDKLFADCDAALSDPARVLTLGAAADGQTTVMTTTDGNIVTATSAIPDAAEDVFGIMTVTAVKLPSGIHASCVMMLSGRSVPSELRDEVHDAATAGALTLIGTDPVRIGGIGGGPALLSSGSEGQMRSEVLTNADFPPTASVSVQSAENVATVAIEKYRAAP